MSEKGQAVLKEYRANRRASLLAEIGCQSRMSFSFGRTENISETGMMVKCPETLPINSEINIRFVLPVHLQAVVVQSKGKVVWVRPGEAMGIQFVNLKEEHREEIARFAEGA